MEERNVNGLSEEEQVEIALRRKQYRKFITWCIGFGFADVSMMIAVISYAWRQTELDIFNAVVQTTMALFCGSLILGVIRVMIRNYKIKNQIK